MSVFSALFLALFSPSAQAAPSYDEVIRPILDTKCVSCHSCYDAPCQLNLTDPEGWQRGATKASVYGGLRRKEAPPTRLFEDANGAAEWRDKGFYPVIGETSGSSLLWKAVVHGASHPFDADAPPPEELDLRLNGPGTCPQLDEYPDHIEESPLSGMPYGMAALTPEEMRNIREWLDAGAPIDTLPAVPSSAELSPIHQWEAFLNQGGERERLVARYLYEHFYIARVFLGDQAHAYRLVRSATPSGTPIQELATRRPNEPPGQPVFYYRFKLVQGTRVRKSHLPVVFDEAYLSRLKELFFTDDWITASGTASDWSEAQNPFESFRDIPIEARYRFLLEHSWYFISNFIRGPVCRGPIALNVIQDRFFLAFLDPEADLNPAFIDQSRDLLDLPGSTENFVHFTRATRKLARAQRHFLRQKGKQLEADLPHGRTYDDLWTGDPGSRLTIFRHRDSSTVIRDWVGEEPDTIWVMDYTTFERTYYSLVANFDVFGPVFHQTATRLYFDFIRAESEDNFLLFLPAEHRNQLRNSWYQGLDAKRKQLHQYKFAGKDIPTGITYQTDQPKLEWIQALQPSPPPVTNLPPLVETIEAYLHELELHPQPTARELPEMTVLHIVVDGTLENDLVYSITRDRAHSNIAFMLREKARLDPDNDQLSAVPHVLGDYPNRIFKIPADEVDAFFGALSHLDDPDAYVELIERYGIYRTDPALFEEADWLYRYDMRRSPLTAGRLDLYRYGGDLPEPGWFQWVESMPIMKLSRKLQRKQTK